LKEKVRDKFMMQRRLKLELESESSSNSEQLIASDPRHSPGSSGLEIVNLEEFAFESPSKAGMEIESSSSIIVSKEGYLRDIEPTMGGEDFAFLAEVIPFTFFLVGQGSGGDEKYHVPRTNYGLHYGLHHPSFALDEEGLPIGVELHANLALR
jgi:hypothetical protein